MMRLWFLILFLALVPSSPTVAASEYQGKVVSVLDGDSLQVLNGHHADRIRLSGIDCPENGQAYSKKAKQAASALAFGKEVTIQTHGHDKYKRTLTDVILPDGMNLNHELVKQSWCWWYRKYAPLDTELEKLEKEARDAKKGLWVDPAPIPPWVYRKARRGQAPDTSDIVRFANRTIHLLRHRSPSSYNTPRCVALLSSRRTVPCAVIYADRVENLGQCS